MIKLIRTLKKGFIKIADGILLVMIVRKLRRTDKFRISMDCRHLDSQVQPVGGFLPIFEVTFPKPEKRRLVSKF